ncbi:GNAT family N-acetyltransferase [Natranaerobius thermophilus]|uniref:Acetyltransferase involved in intracellular survival and related acetyltransferase-like protein n=1 Tax=Natranaerobius thermophilus (strain ATCC BAA-1301 / DSM 18059 / JW/NM-WN-LF) TaxID=457570 RepID=B2A6P9_NATTJ|nr:GNAT family N-acetyltransferase [Natranaerobius thermophilus]ACB84182.1 acetyltransferase involved in intracellular survival and related acetyltransferase-like protein [Natranaerobius thermophilus JW/NM-WN-LF]
MAINNNVSYKALTDDLELEYKNHQGYAFTPEDGPQPEGPKYPDRWRGPAIGEKRGIFQNEQLVSVGRLLPTEISIGGNYVPAGGIADVATMPENRGKGFFKQLFSGFIQEMRDRGLCLSILWPSSYHIYSKLGYSTAGSKIVYDMNFNSFSLSSNIKLTEKKLEFVPIERGQEHDSLKEVYRRNTKKFNLSINRDSNWWDAFVTTQSKVSSGKPAYVYAVIDPNDNPEDYKGYLIYDFDTVPSVNSQGQPANITKMRIRELVYDNFEVYSAILKFISGHSLQAEQLSIEGITDQYFTDKIMAPEALSCQIESGPMVKIVDVVSALSYLEPPKNLTGKLNLQIEDKFTPDNSGIYMIEVEEGNISVNSEPTTTSMENPDFIMDINSLSQIYAGYIQPYQLVQEQRITPGNSDPEKLTLLNRIFPSHPIFPLEYF